MARNTLIQRLIPHIFAFFVFLIVSSLYFLPQFEGKVMRSGDMSSYKAMYQELSEFQKETGETSWWTNSIFAGMPAYQINGVQPSNLFGFLERINRLYIPRPIGYFFGMAFIFYFLLLYLKVSPHLSIIGALGFSFSVGNMALFEAGHMTKIMAITAFSPIVIGMLMIFRKDFLRGGILFATGLGLSLYANHVQMTYYFFLALGVYVLLEVFAFSKTRSWGEFGKIMLVILLATFMGAGSSTSKLWTTYEFSKDTMRGDPILTSTADSPSSSSGTKGLDWNYAMNWSNGLLDLASSIIPGVAGGGTQEELGKDSELYKDLKSKRANLGNNFKAPLYFGSLPFTSGPYYFGAIFCFLFILGLILMKGPLKWWLGIAMLLLLFASMGKHFALFNRPLFDFFPLFNKFRTPNSVLTVAGFFLPILGILTVSEIIKGTIKKDEVIRGLKIALGITGSICLFFALIGPSVIDVTNGGDSRLEQAGYNLQALYADRKSLMRSDALRSLLLILASGGLLWAFVQQKIKTSLLVGAIAILAIGDLLLVDKRYVDESDFVKESLTQSSFVPREADKEILKDKDPHYRVFDLSINTFNSASSSYFHKTIGGYNPAKLQRYEDIINYHLLKGNQSVLAMLNTKYVITQDQKAQRFPGLGNAWMVSELKMVNTANEEIDGLKEFDPAKVAVVHQEYADYVNGLNPSGSGSISLTEYRPNFISYQSNTTSEELAVFSEVWYGPDKGWTAYIDGQPAEHIRVNYILRALKIPAGAHQIEFRFDPRSFRIGETITFIFSLLVLLAFFGMIGYELYQAKLRLDQAPPVEAKAKQPLPKTKTKKKRKK